MKRALSKRQGPCRGARYIPAVAEGVGEECHSSENEDLYDEMYDELYQDVFQEHTVRQQGKKRQNKSKKIGMIL